jgi:dTDP-4-amino-4,6-dideoxygalactose transaminase
VHWGGYPVDLDKIRKIQAKAYQTYGFRPLVIQDCAHAIGSTYKGKHLADTGDICTFSFQAIKHMTCGDGGALVVPYKELYDRAKLTRWYGIDRESNRKDFRCETDIKEFGFKFHMNDISATIGLSNLPFLRTVLDTHRTNANLYNEKLKNIPGLTLLENKSDRESSYWIYTIKVQNREGFMKKMSEAGIQVSRVHERNDKHTCVNEFKSILPNLDQVVNEMICIPVGWWVTKENAEFIIDTIKKGW